MLDALAALTRAVLYAGLLSGAGAAFAAVTLHGSQSDADFLAKLMRRGALVTIVAGLFNALLLIFRLGGQFDQATLSAVFLSSVGAATCLQLVGAILLLASPGSDPLGQGTRLSNAALAMSSFGFSGHGAADGFFAGVVACLHVSAAAWWIGSLWLLQHACAQSETGDIAILVRRFSGIAVKVIGGLVAAGVILILALIDFSNATWLSPYAQILAMKIGIVVLVLALASYNKFRLTPRLAQGDAAAISALRKMIRIELGFIGAILATTAILTTYFSPN